MEAPRLASRQTEGYRTANLRARSLAPSLPHSLEQGLQRPKVCAPVSQEELVGVSSDVGDGQVEEADAPDELVPHRLVLRDGVPVADSAGEVSRKAPYRAGLVTPRNHEL